ncbi:hypothetical protein Vafri_18085 [Volvox africanus]|uniref:Leucine-rich repeat-containing N-terminal plant-type domain-containing protein n=1 Tax=Volvox africanus TaxID=51714 RepID=A0A8J4F8B2_9CHLO|nr:hypothetical protein Vafri_18085 [Volvox africanus]
MFYTLRLGDLQPLRVTDSSNAPTRTALQLQIMMENTWVYYVRYTVLFHVQTNTTQLAATEAALLGASIAKCCRPKTRLDVGTWCGRVMMYGGNLSSPNLCAMPEALCSRDGSLLKLMLAGGLDCTDANTVGRGIVSNRLTALAKLNSLAWLDLSSSNLNFELRLLTDLLARPNLEWLILQDAALTGPLPVLEASPATRGLRETAGSSTGPMLGSGWYGGATGGVDGPDGAGTIYNGIVSGNIPYGNSKHAINTNEPCATLAPAGRRVLVLSDNSLTGEVPKCLASHATLEELRLDGNHLTRLPSVWSDAVSMLDLDVSSNPELVGPVASLPPNLTRFNASFTSLGGGLPAPLPGPLIAVDLESAMLSGPLDTAAVWELHVSAQASSGGSNSTSSRPSNEIWRSPLALVSLSRNMLVGRVPDPLPPALRLLFLDNNLLDGPLPDSILPRSLQYFNCSDNRLSGLLPVGPLPNARVLDFSLNLFSGPLAPALARLPILTYLNVSSNSLGGSLAPFASSLTPNNVLLALDLSYNFFSGSLPLDLRQLAVLNPSKFPNAARLLDISYNILTGNVPSYMYEVLPMVAFNCQCIAVVAEGNHFTCPKSASTSYNRIIILKAFFFLPCFDENSGGNGCRYNLGQWLAGDPPATCRMAVPQALKGLSWDQVLEVGWDLPSSSATGAAGFMVEASRGGSNHWPLINILTVVLATLTGSVVVLMGVYVGVRWASRTLDEFWWRRDQRRLERRENWARRSEETARAAAQQREGLPPQQQQQREPQQIQQQEEQQQQHQQQQQEQQPQQQPPPPPQQPPPPPQQPPPPPPPPQQQQQQQQQYRPLRSWRSWNSSRSGPGGAASTGAAGETHNRIEGGARGASSGHVSLVLAAADADMALPAEMELPFWQPGVGATARSTTVTVTVPFTDTAGTPQVTAAHEQLADMPLPREVQGQGIRGWTEAGTMYRLWSAAGLGPGSGASGGSNGASGGSNGASGSSNGASGGSNGARDHGGGAGVVVSDGESFSAIEVAPGIGIAARSPHSNGYPCGARATAPQSGG